MSYLKFYYSALFLTLVISSCTKVIDLKLGDQSGKLVIEGNINDQHGQVITLSRNVPFTNSNVYPPVSGATVTVSIGTLVYNFTEGPAGTYSANRLVGFPGLTYTMTVVTGGVTYTAKSTMPQRVDLDSITEANTVFNTSKNSREISVHFHDPAGVVNQYNFLLYVNNKNKQVNTIFAYNDDFTNGRFVDIDLLENNIDIHPGDQVGVEMQCIDKPMYIYWYSLLQQSNNFGQGIAPSNPPNNITPAVLGYFSAHTGQVRFLRVK